MLYRRKVIAVIAFVTLATINSANAEVIHVQSSLAPTGREHACPDEPLIFTCEVNGQYIQWTFNSYYRSTFFYDHDVNSVETVSGQHGIRAILTGNDDTSILNSPNSHRHLTSALIIQSSDSLSGYLHNVSCSSDTETHTQQLKIAETPNIPLNVQVNRTIMVQLSAPYNMLSVSWDVPDNNKKFDFDHFKVHVMLPDHEQEGHCITNGTSMEAEYHFHSDEIPPQTSNIRIVVTTVSKCSQQGSRSLAVDHEFLEPQVTTIPSVEIEDAPKEYYEEYNNGYKKVITDVRKVVLAFVLAMSIIFSP